MGDNIWLNDRDAVRTPMQWTPDRNSGFSSVDPGKLYLPVISSLVYHYNNVNVEAQMASSASLLHWVRGMLQIRSRHPVFGLGDFSVVPADNEGILAFTRSMAEEGGDPAETVLCINNLTARPQAATLQFPLELAGAELVDLFGGSGFPRIGEDGRVMVTLGSRDFFWFQLRGREDSH
jgi:maltose alpha-D-glucosyltransferase/alpha-amylase